MNKSNLFISNSKKNFIFILKLILFFVCALGYVDYVIPQYEGTYTASLVDKMERLKSIEDPKIVLLGNSNLAFGICSQMLEEEFGMPIVNMGLHGGLSNRFHENMAMSNVQEGDIYIVCHTQYWDDDSIGDAVLTWTTIENHMELWELLQWKDIVPMMKAFPTYFKKCLDLHLNGDGNKDLGDCYSRSGFNKYGDVSLLREESKYTFESEVWPFAVNDVTVNRLNDLNQYIEKKGATLLIAGYPIGNGDLTVEPEKFIEAQADLEEGLDCEVISDYTDYLMDYKYFYDTEYHLTTEGAVLRTEQLITDIKNWKENIY